MRFILLLRRFLLREERSVIAGNREVRRRLRKRPFLYALFGGTGVVLFWRGVWHMADEIPYLQDAWVSLAVGTAMLFASGLLVFQLIGQAALEERIDDLTQAEKQLEVEERRLANEERTMEKQMAEEQALEQQMADAWRKRG